jgi:hypothetical protein
LVPIPEQQEAIRQMRRLKAKGLSLRAIAACMTEKGTKISHVGVQRCGAGSCDQAMQVLAGG